MLEDGSVHFSVWAPLARQVEVAIHSGGETRHRLEAEGKGVFALTVPGLGPGVDYSYRLDGGPDRPDPVSRHRPEGVHGPSRVVDPEAFAWSAVDWRGVEAADLVIYELHVGTFTREGTFDAAIPRLAELRELGVTAIEIMPVAEFPGNRNWGYDGVSLYAPQSTYGGPDGLKRLVDAAHREGLAVILDVVYNHLGPEGNYILELGPYFSDRYKTLWGEGWNLDGPDSDEVRRYLVENALYWITEFRMDGLRLDAADKIIDLSAQHFLEELATAVHAQAAALGRRVVVIAESDANDPKFVRPPAQGGYGLDAQWADDFHHAVHAVLTGERQGYYVDFGGLAPIAKALTDHFVYDGRYSLHRRRRFGRVAADVPADRFVICIQNHDQVGNRARGERLAALVPFEATKLAAALMLLSPHVPLLFMGEEHGELNPFLYFVSHGDPALVEAVREGRRREFAAFKWAGEVPDPQAVETFEASRPDWGRVAEPRHGAIRRLYRDLLRLRREEPALRPGAAEVQVRFDEEEGWLALSLPAAGRRLLVLCNFAGERRGVPVTEPGVLTPVLDTEAPEYQGAGGARLDRGRAELPALSALLLRGEAV